MTPALVPAIDLRSDTVTRPSAAMRGAMAGAEVGDDVLGDDPTVALLQRRAAALLGQDAALFVPSGSMANQIGLLLHCRPGDEVIVSEGAHMAFHEAGAPAALAGVNLLVVGAGRREAGTFTAADVALAAKSESRLSPPTALVCVENTHNRGGGTVWSDGDLAGVVATARERGLALHLDGARLINAAVASGRAPADLAAPFDTVTLAFSKGLGAPIGSVIAGRHRDIERAARLRKMLGGGMRQAGIVAAGALWALDHNLERIAVDHENARFLATGLAALPCASVDLDRTITNIVMVDVAPPLPPASELVAMLDARGVRVLAFGARRIRLVTHLDVDRTACAQALEHFAAVFDIAIAAGGVDAGV